MSFRRVLLKKQLYNFSNGPKNLLKTDYRTSSEHINSKKTAPPLSKANFSTEEWDEFLALQPNIIADITNLEPYNKLPFFTTKIKNMLEYNLTGGTTGLNTIYAYKMISKPADRTPENIRLAVILGWCMRFYEALILVMDDFIDGSPTRHKKHAWHCLPQIGKNAPLHSMFIENCMHFLLQKYFSEHPQYKNILGIFLTSVFYENYSQILDTIPFNEDYLTQDFLKASYFGKTEQTTFYLSVTLAMYLADIQNPEIYEKMKRILIRLGSWFQLHNDYSDVFDQSRKRPIGTDIRMSRITWLTITSYQKCNSEQKKLMCEHYGNDSEDSVNRIVKLYEELEMSKEYEETLKELRKEILEEMKDLPNDIIPHEVIYRSLDLMEQRSSTC